MENTKLVRKFGLSLINQELIERIERLTGRPAHHFLKRGIFCGHRGLTEILNAYERGERFYLYTGRGPSSQSLHLGHLIPLEFTRYLQEVFRAPLIIQMTDDEKYLRNQQRSLKEIQEFCNQNLLDLIALGFDPKLTFIFRDTEMIGKMYTNILRMQRQITLSQVRGAFGLKDDSDNLGVFAFPINQAVPAISSTFPEVLGTSGKIRCLIPCAVDQDVYFRLTRDICHRIKEPKPSTICSIFLPDLRGPKAVEIAEKQIKEQDRLLQKKQPEKSAINDSKQEEMENHGRRVAELSKMSSTSQGENPAVIFLNFSMKKIAKIVKQHAFSGGAETLEEHRMYGARPEVDMSIQYLRFFCPDDQQLDRVIKEYRQGILTVGQVKNLLIQILQEMISGFQQRRASITPEMIAEFTQVRNL